MELNSKKNQKTIVVYLKGRLDIPQVEETEKEILKLLDMEKSSNLILNLRDIDYVSSAGIALFVTIMIMLKQRGKLFGICDLKSSVKRIMEMVEVSVLFNIFADEKEAFEFLDSEQMEIAG